MIVIGDPKSRSCLGRSSTAIACASWGAAILNTAAGMISRCDMMSARCRFRILPQLDFFVSYWKVGPVGHTFLSFVFDNAPPLCISIETRPEMGEGFSPIASLFKQFELIYIVGDERDIVRVRTNFRDEEVYLYRIRTSPENVRRLFLVYLGRINELADHAEFYHLLSNSCTINIVRYANAAGRVGQFDIRHLLNGFIDRYLYRAGLGGHDIAF